MICSDGTQTSLIQKYHLKPLMERRMEHKILPPGTVSFVSFYPEICQNTPKPAKLLVRVQIQTGVAS